MWTINNTGGIRKVIVFMFDFKEIRNSFGDNPFSTDLENVVIVETSRPYRAGEYINFQGFNYSVQKDVQTRKKILLVKNGLVAIPETSEKNISNTRLVLDRHVNPEIEVLSSYPLTFIWGVDGSFDYVPNSAYYFFNRRRPSEETLNTDIGSDVDYAFIYVDPLKVRNKYQVSTFFFYDNKQCRYFTDSGTAKTPYWSGDNFPWDPSSFSICNSWIWVPGGREDDIFNPNLLPGKVGSFSNNNWSDSVSGIYTGDYTNIFSSSYITTFEGSMYHLPSTKAHTLSYVYSYDSVVTPEEAIGGGTALNTTQVFTGTYSRPKLADVRTNRVISYEVDNLEVEVEIRRSLALDTSFYSMNKENSYGAYLYDYSLDPDNPEKFRVNHFGPYVLSLYTESSANVSSNIKSDYEVGDTVTFNYSLGFVSQGFPALVGNQPTLSTGDTDADSLYTGTIVQDELDEYLEASVLPIENAWGWVPTTDGHIIGVKARITALSTTDTSRGALSSNNEAFRFLSVNRKSINSFTFEITSIEIPKTLDETLKSKNPYTKGSSRIPNRNGWIQYGKSLSSINTDPYDHPLNYLLNNSRDILESFQGQTILQDSLSNRYWWEDEYIWHLDVSTQGVGKSVSFVFSQESKLYVAKYKLVFNSTKDRYDLEFQNWDIFLPNTAPGKPNGPVYTYATNDLSIIAPDMVI